MTHLREHGLDLMLGLLVIAMCWFTLEYPFGRDQGLFHYVGREWLVHGEMPYRDSFEQKTPGIFFVHGVLAAVTGSNFWAIRAADIAVILATSLAASLALGERQPGRAGITALALAGATFGTLNYWDTAQTESWAALFAICALALARRSPLATGMAVALALAFKPPVLPMTLIAIAIAIATGPNGLREMLRRAAAIAVGGALVAVLVLAPFVLSGAFGDLADIMLGANPHYVAHESGVADAAEAWRLLTRFFGTTPIWSTGLTLAWCAGLAWAKFEDQSELVREHLLAALLFAAALAGVALQAKYFRYHFGLLAAPLAFVVALEVRTLAAALSRPRAGVAAGALVLGLLGINELTYGHMLEQIRHTQAYRSGAIDRDAYLSAYQLGGYSPRDNERVRTWLVHHVSPGDQLCVRGFEPAIYVGVPASCPSRFFWTSWLVSKTREYRRQDYLEQDLQALEASPPRFVVSLVTKARNPDSTLGFLAGGYRYAAQQGRMVILERTTIEHALELNDGDRPDPRWSPLTLRVSATVEGDGVVAAQGGSLHGWALHIDAGRPTFAVRSGGRLHELSAPDPVDGRVDLVAAIAQNGRLSLGVDGVQVAQGPGGFLHSVPNEPVSLGRDADGPVGTYDAESPLQGELHAAALHWENARPARR